MFGLRGIGFPELLIILVIVIVLFGARKLPEIGSGLGKSIINFKKAMKHQEKIGAGASDEDAEEQEEDQ